MPPGGPPVGVTQLFGSPSDEMLLASALSSPSSAPENFGYGYAAHSNAQPAPRGLASIHESAPNEIAYFDLANSVVEDPLHSQFLSASAESENRPVANPPAPRQAVTSARHAPLYPPEQHSVKETPPPVVEPAPAVVPPWVEKSVEQGLEFAQPGLAVGMSPSVVEKGGLLEDEHLAHAELSNARHSCMTADLPDHITNEIRRVEDEQAARLHRHHQSEEFLMPARKTQRRMMIFLVVLLVILLAAIAGAWLILSHPPTPQAEAQGHVLGHALLLL